MIRTATPPKRSSSRRTRSWFLSVERYRECFPRLLRAEYWRGSRAESLLRSLLGVRSGSARGATARGPIMSRLGASLGMEPLEARQMLSATYYVNDDWYDVTTGGGPLNPGDTVTNTNDADPGPVVMQTYNVNAFSTI